MREGGVALICPHCEKSTEINCHCDKPETISSMNVPDDVRDLALDLTPWPISNERAWAIINDHLEGKRSKIGLLRATIKHQERIIEYYEKKQESAGP
jgi:hypothetical protein